MRELLKLKHIKLRIITFACVVVLCCFSFIFQFQIETELNKIFNPVVSSEIKNSNLKLHFINVGQGDCSVVEFPDGKVMVIDSGTLQSVEVVRYYLEFNIFRGKEKVIDYFVLTHSDSDHCGGAKMLFEQYRILNCFRPNIFSSQEALSFDSVSNKTCDDSHFLDFVDGLNKENCNVIINKNNCESDIFVNDYSYNVQFLSPLQDSFSNVNDYSPVIVINYNGIKTMYTGDISSSIENDLLDTYDNDILDIDILKVAHHGSASSSCDQFLEIISPKMAIISAGVDNTYNLPSYKTMNSLNEYIGESNVFQTNIMGDIAVGVYHNQTIEIWNNSRIRICIYISLWYLVIITIALSGSLIFCIKKR